MYSNFEEDTTDITEATLSGIDTEPTETLEDQFEQQVISSDWDEEESTKTKTKTLLQLHNKYIFTQLKSGFLIIDQQRAHERVLYEEFIRNLDN